MKPKIFVFSNVVGGREGLVYAMAEDGTVLGSHWCSNESFAPYDLGVVNGTRPDRHERYKEHYPKGYEMEFVRVADIDTHEGLQKALTLNQNQSQTDSNGG